LLNVLPNYDPRPLIVFASLGDVDAYETALALQENAQGSFSLQGFDGDRNGLALIDSETTLAEIIRQWLQRFLVI